MKNNQDKVAKKVNDLKLVGVDAVADDGSVCIQIDGDKNHVISMSKIIMDKVGDVDTDDGVQKGGMCVNSDLLNIHDDLYKVANLD